MHNFVYFIQRRSQKFSCEPNFGGGGRAPRPSFPLAAPLVHRDYLLKLLRRQGLPDAQLSVIANAVIISRLLYRYALPAWGGFLSVKLINRINAFYDVCSVLAISNVVSL